MKKVSINQIKTLREETSAPINEIKKALEEARGDKKEAKEILKKLGFARAAKKAVRETKAGIVETYIHPTGDVGGTVVLTTETDFVARTKEFRNLAHEIAMQGTAMGGTVSELLSQPYIRDPEKTISDLIQENIAKFGENIKIKDFKKFEV